MSITCLFKGHVWKKEFRMMVLDDDWPPNYIGKSHKCERCGKQKDMDLS